jgi:hypothetical protein
MALCVGRLHQSQACSGGATVGGCLAALLPPGRDALHPRIASPTWSIAGQFSLTKTPEQLS